MKKHHSPRGRLTALRLLAYLFTAVAILSVREVIIRKDGAVAKKLGEFNISLKTHVRDRPGFDWVHSAHLPLPKGMIRQSDNPSLAGNNRKVLSQASQEAFMAATRVDIDAK